MKLYDCKNKSWVRITESNPQSPPVALELQNNQEIFYDHIDGMYSYCKDKEGNIVHLAAWTEVEYAEDLTSN